MMTHFSEWINRSQPGTMVQHLCSLNGTERSFAGLAVREDRDILARLPQRIAIHSRGAVIQVRNVHLIVLMLRFASSIYETFVSMQHEDSAEFVARMAVQSHFSILLFDGFSTQPARAFLTQNGFRTLFQTTNMVFADWPGWAYADFDLAKAELYVRYPTALDLWQALGRQTGDVAWQQISPGKN